MASTTIQRTPSSSGSNSVFTMSMWIKRSNLGVAQCLWSNGGSPQGQMSILAGDDLIVYDGSTTVINTNRKFRDVSAWYHIVLTCDAGASGDDKVKLYVNGVLETSFATDNRSSFSDLNNVNQSGQEMSIGSNGASGQYFDGVMSHINLIDGTAYGADTFGSIDATTGEWKIKTSPSVTYGTNGFFLKMEDSSNMDLDSSSNALTFTTNGTLTKSECCPSNVFATWNPLGATAISYKNGNNTIYNSTNWQNSYSTLGMTKGKYYAEFKTLTDDKAVVGINPINTSQSTITGISGTNNRWGYGDGARDGRVLTYNGGAGSKTTGGTDSTYSSGSISANDILMVAVDMDNYIIWTGVNGTWHNSATATEIQNGTTTNAMFTGFNSTSDTWFFAGTVENSTLEANFGNGYFGTTAISSEGTNASGIGKFEYDGPTGYTALSTKGLNE